MLEAVVIEGDGVGPEVVRAAIEVVDAAGVDVEWSFRPAGYGAYERYGHTAPVETIEAVRDCGTALKGPFETPSGGTVQSANLYLRIGLDLYACLRPLPLATGEVLLVRENVEDHYPAIEWWAAPGVAQAVKVATSGGCERISRYAFEVARAAGRRRVTVVHKANNLKLTEGLFLDTALGVARSYPEIEVEDLLADTACSEFVLNPGRFDVVLANNTFGDLLSNIGAAVAGSLGLVASLNEGNGIVVTEASHGSAPELAGTGRANPVAMIKAAAMLLAARGHDAAAHAIETATADVIRSGVCTPDLGGVLSTQEVGQAIAEKAAALVRA